MGCTARARLSRRIRARAAAEGGFTLVELLTAMVILLIVLTSLTSVLVSASRAEVDANRRFQAQEQARSGLDMLRHELHCASSVTDTSGNSLTAGTACSAITATLGYQCPTTGGAISSGTMYVTWCTSTTGASTAGDYALYRVISTTLPRPTCSSAGTVKWMDYLQPTVVVPVSASTPFCLPSTTAACDGVYKPSTSLPMLHVNFPLNLNGPTSTVDSYKLVDDIALRNGARS
jgi:prepilin-type N-terminal cleavage/methylation domain-containing protein